MTRRPGDPVMGTSTVYVQEGLPAKGLPAKGPKGTYRSLPSHSFEKMFDSHWGTWILNDLSHTQWGRGYLSRWQQTLGPPPTNPHTHRHACMHTHTYTHFHTQTHIHIFTHKHTYTYSHIPHSHPHTHNHIPTHTHTHPLCIEMDPRTIEAIPCIQTCVQMHTHWHITSQHTDTLYLLPLHKHHHHMCNIG